MSINPDLRAKYEIFEWKHAISILCNDFLDEWKDISEVLTEFNLCRTWITEGGGRKSKISEFIDSHLYQRGWEKKFFDIDILVNNRNSQNTSTHKIDCFKNRIGLEIEWNNKDPFFDRDLNNFRLLFDLNVLDVGIIITRCDKLQDIFKYLNKGNSYGASTTQMGKLIPRILAGGANGCPILVFGIKKAAYKGDC